MADKIIIFSGKQYSGKDTAAKILMEAMPDFKRCAMGDIIKIEALPIEGYHVTTMTYNQEEIEEIKRLSEEVTKERLLYIIMDLSKLENDMKWSSQKSILFQVEIIKLCSENLVETHV